VSPTRRRAHPGRRPAPGRRRGRAALGLLLGLAAALAAPGCGTCRPERARVEPRVGGSVGVGSSGGSWTETWIGIDITNVFCRDPGPDEAAPPEETEEGAGRAPAAGEAAPDAPP